MRLRLGTFLICALVGCSSAEEPVQDPGSPFLPPATNQPQPGSGPAQPGTPKEPAKPALDVLHEAVYVLFKGPEDWDYMCTGALVSKDVVVTAAHCLDDSFYNWEIVAPLSPNKSRVSASRSVKFGNGDADDPSQPDIGVLILDEPIELPAYAELTDVTARVERGDKLTAATIVRTAEEPEAPFKAVENLAISSTKELGYADGFSTPEFSIGGDSGAGLFLVEDGRVTHKLIATARNPDPEQKVDHFTGVGAQFIDWFRENTTNAN